MSNFSPKSRPNFRGLDIFTARAGVGGWNKGSYGLGSPTAAEEARIQQQVAQTSAENFQRQLALSPAQVNKIVKPAFTAVAVIGLVGLIGLGALIFFAVRAANK